MSISTPQYNSCEPKKRVPKRVLHFSDGTLEEYSTDEEELEERRKQEEKVEILEEVSRIIKRNCRKNNSKLLILLPFLGSLGFCI